jgi:phosphonate transport system permease protein
MSMWFTPRNVLIALLLTGLVLWSGWGTGVSVERLVRSWHQFSDIFAQWFPPNWDQTEQAFNAILITLQMSFFGSFAALVVVIPLSFLAAKNTSPHPLIYHTLRSLFSILRSIPDIVIGLMLIMAMGTGPFPATMAILVHNIGVLGKLISELVEAAEKGPQEAVQSLGLSKGLVAQYGILPQIFPNVLSHYFYRFEVAIRSSVILGFLGGGGLGQLLYNSFRTFQYADVTVYVLFIMVLVIVVDALSGTIRNRVI